MEISGSRNLKTTSMTYDSRRKGTPVSGFFQWEAMKPGANPWERGLVKPGCQSQMTFFFWIPDPKNGMNNPGGDWHPVWGVVPSNNH